MSIDTVILANFALLWLTVVPVPGPNVLMVTHVAVTRSTSHLASAIAGNVAGVAMMALLAMLGWAAALEAFPRLRLVISLFGGLYLVYFGIRMIRAGWKAGSSLEAIRVAGAKSSHTTRGSFALGFFTALSNAQALFFITSVFAAAGVIGSNLVTGIACVIVIICLNTSYVSMIGWLLQRQKSREIYFRLRHYLETVFGLLFIGFGFRLLLREWSQLP